MIHKNKLLSVLSDAEQEALYGLPDFDDGQRLEFLSLSETELALASSRPGLPAQVYCLLQIGYFKAKHAFFRFDWNEVEDDCAFVLSRYFHGDAFERKPITKHEHYTQREQVAELFGYLRDPQLERNVHRSQNRVESYHQLRSTIAQVGGKKELTGRTDIEIEISNPTAPKIPNGPPGVGRARRWHKSACRSAGRSKSKSG